MDNSQTMVQSAVMNQLTPPSVAVCADPPSDSALLKAAARVAVDLNLPFLDKPQSRGWDMLLVAAEGRLELRILTGDAQMRGGRALWVNLDAADVSSPAGKSLRQPIAKAVGLKSRSGSPITIIDATAGWGGDSWLLANLGCRVLAVERNRIIATLLRDGIFRACSVQPDLFTRLSLITADARHLLRRLVQKRLSGQSEPEELPAQWAAFLEPDVVYLDPMFPGHARRKTAEAKPLRVLRRLVGDDEDAEELFHWALRAARKRVVVKRPNQAPHLSDPTHSAGIKPVVSHQGKSLRYDVYVIM